MKWMVLTALICGVAWSADYREAQQEEKRECIACHSLRLVHSQRLSAATWGKELDKMAGWGAAIKNRQLLLDYLAAEYPDSKPVPDDPKSADGRSENKK